MGSYNGREVCKFVRLYLLNKLMPLFGTKNIVLYRDDGLAVIHQANGPKIDKIRKNINTLFKFEGLSITTDKLDRNRLLRCLIQPRDGQIFSL